MTDRLLPSEKPATEACPVCSAPVIRTKGYDNGLAGSEKIAGSDTLIYVPPSPTRPSTFEELKMSNRIPRKAKTHRDIVKLSHDNVLSDDFSMMLDEKSVYLSQQSWGEERGQHIQISRKAFDAFVGWYTTGKVPPGDRAARTPPED